MREIVFDTETTGFDPETGDRVVEIGAVELVNQLPTGRSFHKYINPERSMPTAAFEVHGLSEDFLRDKPLFKQIAREFLDFVGTDSVLVAHNAGFDMKFIAWELRNCGLAPIPLDRSFDTADFARKKFPGSPASLDALCKRFGIDNSAREKHGALLDAELLAEVYLELRGGRQTGMLLQTTTQASAASGGAAWRPQPRPAPLPSRLTPEEDAAHKAFVEKLGESAIWLKYRH